MVFSYEFALIRRHIKRYSGRKVKTYPGHQNLDFCKQKRRQVSAFFTQNTEPDFRFFKYGIWMQARGTAFEIGKLVGLA